MNDYSMIRVGAAVPIVAIANPQKNVDRILELVRLGTDSRCDLIFFPELSVAGYTCADLFPQSTLLAAAATELARLAKAASAYFPGLIVVGAPVLAANRLYNAAVVLHRGKVLGAIPKSYLPNYREFYEHRWFSPAGPNDPQMVEIAGQATPFGIDLLFDADEIPKFTVGIEICEDLWTPIPPSSGQALAGATVLLNLSASNEAIGKADYRRDLVVGQSGRCLAAYAYVSSGVGESTTDLVYGGHAIIAENGVVLAENRRFGRAAELVCADVDLERIATDRARMNSYSDSAQRTENRFRRIPFRTVGSLTSHDLRRSVAAHPFVPSDARTLNDRCDEIFHIQTASLAKRLETVHPPGVHIGVSGGLDSTLALLVAVKAHDLLGIDRGKINGLTMPGFGTSGHTRNNANRLMKLLGVSFESIDIRQLCFDTFVALGHKPFGIELAEHTVGTLQEALAELPGDNLNDLIFENVQARTRMHLLMNRGFVVGTGDLSELALGWSTYGADHMSMYNPNCGVPKTLVKFLVRWTAENEFSGELTDVLRSIAETEISPELLPVGASKRSQSTEGVIGPYELHDFFLYHVVRFGFGPRKIVFLAENATFENNYTRAELRDWLRVFYQRFFASQYKRSCLPDGPKLGSISLSPRGDWRMPSDAEAAAWFGELDKIK